MGLVQGSADVGHSMKKNRRFVTPIGLKLVVNSTNTIFLLTAKDVILRGKVALHMGTELAHKPQGMAIFVDETALEEAPHMCICFY